MSAPSNCIFDVQRPTRLTSYASFSQKAAGGSAQTNEGGTCQQKGKSCSLERRQAKLAVTQWNQDIS